jgi:hypothetical protein
MRSARRCAIAEHRYRQSVNRGEGDWLDLGHGSYAAIM